MLLRFRSLFFQKCPRCFEGEMFPDHNPYHLKQTAVMHSHCPDCDLNFEPEPGYYYGAMYVSYAFTIAIGVGVFILHYLFHAEVNAFWYILELSFTLLVLSPYTFRIARVIWLSFFVRYDREIRKKVLASKLKI